MPGITGDQMDTLNAIAIQMFEMPFDQLPLEAKKDVLEAARPEERAGGGMMDINRMTAPLGYKEGTPDGTLVGDREDIIQKTNEMITYLNARVAEQSFGTEPAARIINDITEERRKENPDYDRLNEMYSQYKNMDDFAMKVYFTNKREESSLREEEKPKETLLQRILGTIHDVTMRPKKNMGGIISLGGGGLLSSVGDLDTKIKKLELMDLTGPKGLSLAEIDELDNMSASQIDELYKQKFGK